MKKLTFCNLILFVALSAVMPLASLSARPIFEGECGTTYSESGVGLVMTTERLKIEPVTTEQQKNAITEIMMNPENMAMSGDYVDAYSMRNILNSGTAKISNTHFWEMANFSVSDRKTGEVIGFVQVQNNHTPRIVYEQMGAKPSEFWLGLGYSYAPKSWGKGYATEVSKGMSEMLMKSVGADGVYGEVIPSNVGSASVLIKDGMVKIGHSNGYDVYAKRAKDAADTLAKAKPTVNTAHPVVNQVNRLSEASKKIADRLDSDKLTEIPMPILRDRIIEKLSEMPELAKLDKDAVFRQIINFKNIERKARDVIDEFITANSQTATGSSAKGLSEASLSKASSIAEYRNQEIVYQEMIAKITRDLESMPELSPHKGKLNSLVEQILDWNNRNKPVSELIVEFVGKQNTNAPVVSTVPSEWSTFMDGLSDAAAKSQNNAVIGVLTQNTAVYEYMERIGKTYDFILFFNGNKGKPIPTMLKEFFENRPVGESSIVLQRGEPIPSAGKGKEFVLEKFFDSIPAKYQYKAVSSSKPYALEFLPEG